MHPRQGLPSICRGTVSQGSLPENIVNWDNGRHDDDAVDVGDGEDDDADSDDGDYVDNDHEGDDDDDHEGDDETVMMLAVYHLRNIYLSSDCGRVSVR